MRSKTVRLVQANYPSSLKTTLTRLTRAKAVLIGLALSICLMTGLLPARAASDWNGVDVKVVEKFAHDAGRPPREPLINTDRGDLLLFVFLVAGAVGGFVAGYCYRALFPPGGVKKA